MFCEGTRKGTEDCLSETSSAGAEQSMGEMAFKISGEPIPYESRLLPPLGKGE
jgi:hypothetical protein